MKYLERLGARNKNQYAEKPALWAFLGDSVTHGCFELRKTPDGKYNTVCEAKYAYPNLVAERLGEFFPMAQPSVLNAGLSGDNSARGLERLKRDVLDFKPELVFVNFGLNDACAANTEDALKRYRDSMRQIFERILAEDIGCILVTPNFLCRYVSPLLPEGLLKSVAEHSTHIQNDGVMARFVDAAREEATKLNIGIADTYAVWEKLASCGADTTNLLCNHINHPSREMHSLFAEEIIRTLMR